MSYFIKTESLLQGELEITLDFRYPIGCEMDKEMQNFINGNYDVFAFYEVKGEIDSLLISEGMKRVFSIKDVYSIFFESISHSIFYIKRKATDKEKAFINQLKKHYK